MADTKLTGLTATTTPVLTDDMYIVTTPGGTPASHVITLATLQEILSVKNVADGRLTLETGVPVSTAAQANKTTLYYTFYKGNKIGLYDGTSWHVRTFTELSIAVGAFTASKPFDVWIYDNAGTPALDTTVWTNDTTRATALAYQDGVLVKSGAATRRYVGTIYIDSGQKCQDTATAKYVWNYYNRVTRYMEKLDTTSHTYTTATERYWNNDATNVVSLVVGVVEDVQQVNIIAAQFLANAAGSSFVGFGLDAASLIAYKNVNIANATNPALRHGIGSMYSCGLGKHFYSLVELSDGTYANTFPSASINVSFTG